MFQTVTTARHGDEAREPVILRDLGDGLILRRAMVADTEMLVAFNAEIHRNSDATEPDFRVGAWTRDLMERDHPTFEVEDFTVVEDTHRSAIVSSLNLISQTWSYAGVPFKVGRPELVGTLPDYRRRGLVRAQFEVIHQWSAERGEKVQAIAGIPYFYRQFGYEMGLTFNGGRAGYQPNVPKLKDGEVEPYRVRPAMEADLAFIAPVYEQAMSRYLVACLRDEALWRYELCGRSRENCERRELRIVETVEGEPVGFLAHGSRLWRGTLGVVVYEVKPGISWLAVTPGVLRYLQATGKAYAERDQRDEFGSFAFWLGVEHPVYQVIPERLPATRKPYAWYVRVADLPDFLRHIAPVLEQRLAKSFLVGHTGDLKLNFYRSGLRLVFAHGKLTAVEPWASTREDWESAGFPDHTFLQLLFGYRTMEELNYAFADCWTGSDEARVLLNTLFPKQASHVWAIA